MFHQSKSHVMSESFKLMEYQNSTENESNFSRSKFIEACDTSEFDNNVSWSIQAQKYINIRFFYK